MSDEEEEEKKPIHWVLLYQDETRASSKQGDWSEQCFVTVRHGYSYYMTRKPVQSLGITHEGHYTVLLPPPDRQDIHFFGEARYATYPGKSAPQWLSTTFGYFLPEYSVQLVIRADTSISTFSVLPLTSE